MSKSRVAIIIDPGISTGVAVFRESVLVYTFTCEPPFTALWSALKRHAEEPGVVLEVVVESMPAQSRHQPATADLQKQLELADCHTVRPSEWKGHPSARLLPGDATSTKHERDAVKLGRYWIATRNARRHEVTTQS